MPTLAHSSFKRVIAALLVGLGLLGTAASHSQVFAQTVGANQADQTGEISLTAIPPRLGDEGEIKIKPGQKLQTSVRVLNTGDAPVDIETFARDFIIDADGKTPIQVKDIVDNRWSLASWLVISPSHQTIAAKKTALVNVLIDVPADARPGGHYAMVLHQPAAAGSTAKNTSSTGVSQQVGSLLYVMVDGPISEQAFVRNFAFNTSWLEMGPAAFSYSIDNQSDIHIRPTGQVEFYNLFHQKVGQVVIEPSNIFPGSLRPFTGTWPIKWGFGPYKAVLTVSYGTAGQLASAVATIWIIPVKIILIVLFSLLSILTLIVLFRRRMTGKPPTPVTASLESTAHVVPPSAPTSPPTV